MSFSANVLSIQALADLKTALARYGAEVKASLQQMEQEARRTQEWLAERQHYWQVQARLRQEEVHQAQAALARCQASAYYDPKTGRHYTPNCSGYEQALRQAMARLRAAETQLHNVQHWMKAIEEALAAYQRQARRLVAFSEGELVEAQALLERKNATLQAYTLTRLDVPTTPAAGVSITPAGAPETPASRGAWFEAWAAAHIFGAKRRVIIPPELNRHLERKDEEGLGLLRQRTSDNYVDIDGSLWDLKAYDENSVIDLDQLRDYALMTQAGYVIDANGERILVKSINYLFSSRAAAEKNYPHLQGYAIVWYVEWHEDGSFEVKLLEGEEG